jgi:hypothetical protein
MVHDNSTPIQTALNALAAAGSIPAGGRVRLPRGRYQVSRPVALPSQVILEGDGGGTDYGTGIVAPGYAWGTTLVWSGPDGLASVTAFDGMRQGLDNLNFDDRNIMASGGPATSEAMTGVHIDTSVTSYTGNDKFQSDSVSFYGTHHAWEIGGNAVADNIFPSGDISELRLNKPHVLDPGATDPRAVGYLFESSNSGFNSTLDEPGCLLDENICIWNASSNGLRVMDAQGSVQQGADLVFALWDSGAGGLFVTGEDENTSGLSLRVSPVQPNAIAATELIANRFNHGIRIDGPVQIVSEANNTGTIHQFTSTKALLNQIAIGSDDAVSSMARVALSWATGQLTKVVAGAQFMPYKTVKAITLENLECDASALTCAAKPTFTLEDCGTAAGACTSPTSLGVCTTTAPNTIIDGAIATPNVAAGHYLVVEPTAGTCTALNASITAMARPR